jgi:opacity protein-like surface antigen
MRKLIVILICSYLSLNSVHAQISSGTIHQPDKYKSNFSLSVKPQLFLPTGYLNSIYFPGGGFSLQVQKHMSDYLSICATGEYSIARGKGYQFFYSSYEALTPSHFLNLSFGPKYNLSTGNITPYITGGVGLLHIIEGKEKRTEYGVSGETGYIGETNFYVNLGTGADYAITNKLSFSLSSKYNAYFINGINKTPFNYLTFQLGTSYILR